MYFSGIPVIVIYDEKGSTEVLIELKRKLRHNPVNAF